MNHVLIEAVSLMFEAYLSGDEDRVGQAKDFVSSFQITEQDITEVIKSSAEIIVIMSRVEHALREMRDWRKQHYEEEQCAPCEN